MNEPATLISTPEEWIERWNDLTSERKLDVVVHDVVDTPG